MSKATKETNPCTKKTNEELSKLVSKYGMQIDPNNTSNESPTPLYVSWTVRDADKRVLKLLQKDLMAMGYKPEPRWFNTHTQAPHKNFDRQGDTGNWRDSHTVQVIRHKTTGYTSLISLHHQWDIHNNFQEALAKTTR